MAAADRFPPGAESASAMLTRELAHVARLQSERATDESLATALDRLAAWQARRLRQTYADLEVQPRYAAAIDFFETDLYGRSDFGARDADIAKVAPLMVRMLPERVITTIAHAMELNALSQELDRSVLAGLPQHATFRVAEYCDAYRRTTDRASRERQIELVAEIGGALDRVIHMPLIHGALVMMRQPARLAGVAALHEFLERGFDAFRRMNGAREFLATIVTRETMLMDAILGGDDAPFVDPAMQSSAEAPAAEETTNPKRRRSEPRAPAPPSTTSPFHTPTEQTEPLPRGRTGRGRRPPRAR